MSKEFSSSNVLHLPVSPVDVGYSVGHKAMRLMGSGIKTGWNALPPTVKDYGYSLYWGSLPQGKTPKELFLDRLKEGYIESELNVVLNGVMAVQADARRAERLAQQLAANPDKRKELSPKEEKLLTQAPLASAHIRGYMYYGGSIVARGSVEPNTEAFPHQTTADNVEQFIDVADLAYSGVKAQASIDPPLRPVGYDHDTFQTLRSVTQPHFNPPTTVIPLR